MKDCIVCKKAFTPNSSVHKLCADECIEEWNEIYYKNKYQSFKYNCVECGKEFKFQERGLTPPSLEGILDCQQ